MNTAHTLCPICGSPESEVWRDEDEDDDIGFAMAFVDGVARLIVQCTTCGTLFCKREEGETP